MYADETFLQRLQSMHHEERHRVLRWVVEKATEELNNGRKRRVRRVVTDVPEEIGLAYEKAAFQNKGMRNIATDRALSRRFDEG